MALKKVAIIVITIALLGAGASFFIYQRQQPKAASPITNQTINVKIVSVHSTQMPAQIEAVGSLVAKDKVAISPQIAGQVAEIMFQAGQFVEKGTPLIKLDDTINQAQYQAALADLKLSELNYHRVTQLAKKGLSSQQAVDQAQADLRDKQSTVHVKHTELNKMLLVAPFAGQLSARTISIGDYVSVGQALVTIVNNNQLTVSYNVPEQQLGKIKVGQKVVISTNVLPGKQLQGKVTYISPTVDTDTRSIAVEAQVSNTQHKLSPGLYVRVRQLLGLQKHSLVVPEEALVPTIDGQIVYVIKQGKALATKVNVGVRFNNNVQILSGVQLGDHVVVAGQQKLKDGAPVRVVTA